MGGLPFHHDELLHVTPFLLYRCGLLLLELIVELKFVLRLFTLAEAIVGYAEPIMCLAQLRIRGKRFREELDRLRIVMLRRSNHTELQVSIGAFLIERDGFVEQAFYLQHRALIS